MFGAGAAAAAGARACGGGGGGAAAAAVAEQARELLLFEFPLDCVEPGGRQAPVTLVLPRGVVRKAPGRPLAVGIHET